MTIQKTLVIGAMIVPLAACGGGSAGSGDARVDALAQGIVETGWNGSVNDVANLVDVDPATLPTTADLTGQVGVAVFNTETTVVGDVNATADFDNGALTGSVSNLAEFDDTNECDVIQTCTVGLLQELTGTLDLDATISGTAFDGDISGTLGGSDADGGPASIQVDAVIANGNGVFGTVDGDLTGIANVGGSVTITSGFGTETSAIGGVLIIEETQ
ncbi:hypothetical protein [Nereida sp. MMG025]|uniref:hypothetical protein n=1 Tax=Nereida sp. MMG025 TaxID=2909981 RepID=UPI001F1AFAF8|nr:hypothetical protein [Nereida sp. MMG025]MCF6443661.1 hypothetical protein [Nereida sp. MMG025]